MVQVPTSLEASAALGREESVIFLGSHGKGHVP